MWRPTWLTWVGHIAVAWHRLCQKRMRPANSCAPYVGFTTETESSARHDSAMRLFEVRVTASRTRAIVRLEGELDMATADDLERIVEDALDGYDELFVDLRGLRFMDTYGLWVLLRAARQAREHAIALRLVRGTGIVDRLFDLTGTRRRFVFVDVTGDDAPVGPQTVPATAERLRIPA